MELFETTTTESTLNLKYYAFDWDDNVVHMPTKIILTDIVGDVVEINTDDFALHREKVGKTVFDYKGRKVADFADNPFRNFKVQGDEQFVIDSTGAKIGPSFNDFKEAINNGSIFAIITARGHNPNTIRKVIYNYIQSGFNGIDKNQLVKNLKKFRTIVGEEFMNETELIDSYLNLCKFYPVSFGDTLLAKKPEDAKVIAMKEFITYIKVIANYLTSKAIYYKENANNFNMLIGFSDDDERNIEIMKDRLDKEDNIKLYLTNCGIKKRYYI